MKRIFSLFVLVIATTAALAQQVQGKEAALTPCGLKNALFVVKLLSPVGTATARPGDTFTMTVDTPEQFAGGVIEGHVRSLVKAERGFGKGKPRIEMEFISLTFNNNTCSIVGELRDVKNSKGVAHVDEEGRAIGHTSNKKRVGSTIVGGLLGAAIGFSAGGVGGAAVGAAAGGATGFTLSSTMTTVGTDIQFSPGTMFTLRISNPKR